MKQPHKSTIKLPEKAITPPAAPNVGGSEPPVRTFTKEDVERFIERWIEFNGANRAVFRLLDDWRISW